MKDDMIARFKSSAIIITLLAACSFQSIDPFVDPATYLFVGGVVVISGVAVGSSLTTLALAKIFGSSEQVLPSWTKSLSDDQQQLIRESRAIEIALDKMLPVGIKRLSEGGKQVCFFSVARQVINSESLQLSFSVTKDELFYCSFSLLEQYLLLQILLSQKYIDNLLVLREESEFSVSEYIYTIIKDLKRSRDKLKKVRSLVCELPEYTLHKNMFEMLKIINTCTIKERSVQELDLKFYRSAARGLGIKGEGWLEKLSKVVDSLSQRFEGICEQAGSCYEQYKDTPMECCYAYIEHLPEYGQALEAIAKRLQEL